MRLSAWLRCLMRVAMALEDIHGVALSVQEHQQCMSLQSLYEHLAKMTGPRLAYVDERQSVARLFDAYDAELARLGFSRQLAAEYHPLRLIGPVFPSGPEDDHRFNTERAGDLIARAMVVHIGTIDTLPRSIGGFRPTAPPPLSDHGSIVLAKAFFAGMVPAILASIKRINARSAEFNQIEAAEAAAQPIFSMNFVDEGYRTLRRPMTH